MTKVHVICHMAVSLDGRALPGCGPPALKGHDLYQQLQGQLRGDAWLIGPITGQEYARAARPYPAQAEPVGRTDWLAGHPHRTYGVVLDPLGSIAWGRSQIDGDPIVVVLTEQVSDACLAGLRADGVSYVFAGEETLDLPLALKVLHEVLGVRRLLLEGGDKTIDAFLRAGLVDEVSVIIQPSIDNAVDVPGAFEAAQHKGGLAAPLSTWRLAGARRCEGDALWLRYDVRKA